MWLRSPCGLRWWTGFGCPDLRAAPRNARPAWALTRVMTALISGMDCGDGGFNPPYPTDNGPIAAGLTTPQRPMGPASFAGRWNGATGGWTTGVGWSLGTTGSCNPNSWEESSEPAHCRSDACECSGSVVRRSPEMN